MHTPEQAKDLWCPMVRLDGVNGSYNRALSSNPTCIADKCAMWRWANNGTGYCGVAGKPGQ